MMSAEAPLDSIQHARALDKQYPSYAHLFAIPTLKSLNLSPTPDNDNADAQSIYLCGNSLGLMPKTTAAAVSAELQAWQDQGVVSHFRRPDGREPWVSIDDPVGPLLVPVLGAKDTSEVAVMNTLTGNLHTMLTAFYKPDPKGRYKILYEAKAFPSDTYAFQGQVQLHGFEPEDALIALAPRESEGEYTLRTEDILRTIEEHGDQIAVVLFSGIQFYTGQLFDIEAITRAGKAKGCVVGWDLAHAVGNVPLSLHSWGVDFAVFCSYKYLNSGPGSIGGVFVHSDAVLPSRGNGGSNGGSSSGARLAGWWGNNPATRFAMLDRFDPIPGAAGFRMSNPSVLNTVCIHESLKTYAAAGGMQPLRARSLSLTGYLFSLLEALPSYTPLAHIKSNTNKKGFTIITPSDPLQRGAQLSLLFLPPGSGTMQAVFAALDERGIISDERQPDVIRLAPNHFYNTHEEVLTVVKVIDSILKGLNIEKA